MVSEPSGLKSLERSTYRREVGKPRTCSLNERRIYINSNKDFIFLRAWYLEAKIGSRAMSGRIADLKVKRFFMPVLLQNNMSEKRARGSDLYLKKGCGQMMFLKSREIFF